MNRVNFVPYRVMIVAFAIISTTSTTYAFEITKGDSEFRLSLNNTLKYSTAFRLKNASSTLTSSPNQDDGNNNFNKGLVSNRFDLLTELDGVYKNFGFRVSGATWYDDVYHRSTDNQSNTSNNTSANEFSSHTKKIMGGDVDLLDALVYANFPVVDGMEGTVRVGRHTLLWGESLFFGANGIAGGQAPRDIIKLSSVPNSQTKETAIPTGKISLDIPLSETLTLGAYVGYEWEKSRMVPMGAYLSSVDTLEGESLLAGPNRLIRARDIGGSDSGQYGIQLKWTNYDLDADFGFYATRHNAYTSSNLYNNFPASEYQFAYAQGIESYGVSMAKSIGLWSLAGEMSYRRNAPLSSLSQNLTPGGIRYDNGKNPGYAIGETAHAQVSWIASLGPSIISREASFIGEVAWNTRLKTTENENMLNPNADRSAVGMRLVYSPTYRQLFDGLDVSPSIGLGHTWGKSSAIGPGFGVDGGGDINFGVRAIYRNNWTASANYITYLGKEANFLDNRNAAQYTQALKDRDFISFSLQTTF